MQESEKRMTQRTPKQDSDPAWDKAGELKKSWRRGKLWHEVCEDATEDGEGGTRRKAWRMVKAREMTKATRKGTKG